MRKILQIIVSILLIMPFLFHAQVSGAQSLVDQVNEQLNTGAINAGYDTEVQDPRLVAISFIQIFIGLLGTIFVFLVVLAGYWMITAHGEEERVTKARKTIFGAVVGIILVLLSYSITYFVSQKILSATGYGGVPGPMMIEE